MNISKNAMFLAAASCFLFISSALADRPLLPQSQRLFPVTVNNEKGSVDYPWLSAHELLHYGSGHKLFRCDLKTKQDTPLPALTNQIENSPAFIDFPIASPCGQWVLWGESANGPLFVAPLDGSRRFSWPGNGGMSSPFWCANGSQWVQFLFNTDPSSPLSSLKVRWTEISIHTMETPDHSEAIRTIPEGLQGLEVLTVVSANEIVARTPDPVQFLTANSQTSVLRSGESATTFAEKITFRKSQQVSVWNLLQSAPLHQWNITLPGLVQEVAISPDGRRVAWLLSEDINAQGKKARSSHSALWISRIDGSQLNEIGFVETKLDRVKLNGLSAAEMEHAAEAVPMEVRWSPDDKHLSFLCKGALWTVPAL